MHPVHAAMCVLTAVEKGKLTGAYNDDEWKTLAQLADAIETLRGVFGLDENNKVIKQPEPPPVEENPVSSEKPEEAGQTEESKPEEK